MYSQYTSCTLFLGSSLHRPQCAEHTAHWAPATTCFDLYIVTCRDCMMHLLWKACLQSKWIFGLCSSDIN